MDLQRACTLLLGVVLLGTNFAARASEIAPRLVDQGQAQLRGGERLSVPIPDSAEDLLFRFSEHAIDLRLHWTVDGQQRQANAAGHRFGEQILTLPLGDPRPALLELVPVLSDAPPGTVRWSIEAVSARASGEHWEMLRLESEAAEFSDQGTPQTDREALTRYQRAASHYLQLNQARAVSLNFRIGKLHGRLKQWSDAEAAFRLGLDRAEDASDRMRLQHALAMALQSQSSFDEALLWFERAISSADALGESYEVAIATNNRCLVLHAQGDMSAAEPCFRRAERAYAEAGIEGYRGVALINLGASLSALGRLEEAQAVFEQARRQIVLLPALETTRLSAGIDLHQAWASMAAGSYRQALEYALSGQALAQQHGQDPKTWGQLIRVTAAALLALGQVDRAREQLAGMMRADDLMAAVADPARLAFASARLESDPAERGHRMREVMQIAESDGDDLTLLRAWLQWARAELELGAAEQALGAANGSLAMARQRQLVEIEIEALGLLAQLQEPTAADQLYAQALQLADSSGRIEDRFRLLHARSRLQQSQGSWQLARASVMDAETAYTKLRDELSSEDQVGLRKRLQPLAAGSLSAGLNDPGQDPAANADWIWDRLQARWQWGPAPTGSSEEEDALQSRAFLLPQPISAQTATDRLQSEMRRLHLERADLRTDQDPVAWRELQRALAGDELLLVLIPDDPVSALLLVTSSDVEVRRLGPGSELVQHLAYLQRGLQRQDPMGEGALKARLAHLRTLLDLPHPWFENARKISFLPGPGMESAPLELLLADGQAVVRLSAESRSHTSPSTIDHLGYRPAVVLEPGVTTSSTAGEWTPLPAARREVDGLLKHLSGNVLRQQGVDAARTLTGGSGQDGLGILHVAGHAFPHPQWSALDELAFGDAKAARVTLLEVRRQRWPADLVVLSACQTALGGQGELGLSFAQGFLQAGARQVLASSWPIDDLGTAVFMEHFYQALLVEGLDTDSALVAAQSRMQADPQWKAPYWWAGFQLWQGLPSNAAARFAQQEPSH